MLKDPLAEQSGTKLWCAALDVGMSGSFVLDMPMEFGLEFMTIVMREFLECGTGTLQLYDQRS